MIDNIESCEPSEIAASGRPSKKPSYSPSTSTPVSRGQNITVDYKTKEIEYTDDIPNYEKMMSACDQCDYETVHKVNLECHIKSNHVESSYSCQQCGYK